MPTYAPNMGFQATVDRDYVPDIVVIPTETGIGNTVDLINAAIFPRHRIPQPFLNYLNEIRLKEIWLPDGYVGKPYTVIEYFTGPAVVSVIDGSLPPGLDITVLGNTLQIAGVPTTIGDYDFTLRFRFGLVPVDFLYHITILKLPSGGAGSFVGGG